MLEVREELLTDYSLSGANIVVYYIVLARGRAFNENLLVRKSTEPRAIFCFIKVS